ncbi:MAG: hypothetical protein ACR2KG_07540 [Nocardioidaceae bacterium]
MNGEEVRADRHALLELDAILARIEAMADDSDRQTFETDDRLRWVLHRLWIAAGNEALAYARLSGLDPRVDQPWARLYQLRNNLAHRRLPDIDEDEVWRMTALRPASLRGQVR